MRNQQAALYARWAAMAAGAITVIVSGFYAERALREYLARRQGPALVPTSVQQQTAGVTYSFSNQNGTTFTIRASHATQFKQGDNALLEDVWVTIFGKNGDRNDNIHTQECSYQPSAGNVQCSGDVEIDVQAASGSQAEQSQPLHVTTSNITFHRESGTAFTPAPVNLTFAGGHGTGTGLNYDSQRSLLTVERSVSFEIEPSAKTGGMPVRADAAALQFYRDERMIDLKGPVRLSEGGRQLAAGHLGISLDAQYRAHTIVADGNPVVSGNEQGADFHVAAQQFTGTLADNGVVREISAVGGVSGERRTAKGEDQFSAMRVDFAMVQGQNLLEKIIASGGVKARSEEGGTSRTLNANGLVVNFVGPVAAAKSKSATQGIAAQRIKSAETDGPAVIAANSSTEKLNVKAAKLSAQFEEGGKLRMLAGHSGVQITRTPLTGAPQTSDAAELVATFGDDGDWSTMDETGGVKLSEGNHLATAAHAHLDRVSNAITLDGLPEYSDGASRTTATSVTIDQKTGAIQATGPVVATQKSARSDIDVATRGSAVASNPVADISLGQGDAHISADTLTGNINSGEVTFRGHAKLWQGQAVLNANQIAIAQQGGRLEASGFVAAVFPQQSGLGSQLPQITAKATDVKLPASTIVWQVHAQRLVYSNAQNMAHLDGGVTASSDQGAMQSRTLDIYLTPAPGPGKNTPANSAPAGGLARAIAQGRVVVSQAGMHGYAEQAEYDAVRNQFTFSGGEPKITDENGDTTTGRSLTFDVASDTISVDSEQGSRTLTRHRVEK